jgi:hypothetical protein
MSLTKLSQEGNNLIIPFQKDFGNGDILAGEGKIANLFYSVQHISGSSEKFETCEILI